MIHQKDTDRD